MGFAETIRDIATAEWNTFGNQVYDIKGHTVHAGHKETEDGWYQRIGAYWIAAGKPGWDGKTKEPWSAAFISWVMKTGGAGNRFHYSPQHSVYISRAIADFANKTAAAGFWCRRLPDLKPSVGDVVCWSRQAGIDYDHQHGGNYDGHCDIVVAVEAGQVQVIGGNVGDSVTRRPLPLTDAGFLPSFVEGGETLFGLMQNRIADGDPAAAVP